MNEIIVSLMPMFLLVCLGSIIRKTKFLSKEIIDGLKKIIFDIVLPVILFLTFAYMKLEANMTLVILIIMGLCLLLYFVGEFFLKVHLLKLDVQPFLMTSFTFGLLGISLFSARFGIEHLDQMAVIGVGHELFVWLIYINIAKSKLNKEKFTLKKIVAIFKSPLLLSVIFGILVNITGLIKYFEINTILSGVMNTLNMIRSLGNPLIFIVVGYGIAFTKSSFRESVYMVVIRVITILIIGYAVKSLIIEPVYEANKYFDAAFFTFLILPPPFTLGIILSRFGLKDKEVLVNNVVALNTVLCLIIFFIYSFVVKI